MSEGYSKDWINKFYDSWYVKQKLNVRGMFDQLRGLCKMQGDNGRIFLRNFRHVGSETGCDEKTARKILRKIHTDGRIKLTEKNDSIEIFIPKYHYWQHVKKVGGGEKSRKSPGKVLRKSNPEDKIREDKIREDKSRARSDKKSDFNTAWDGLILDKKLSPYSAGGINLDTEQLKMINWVTENPGKKNYRRFIINWLNKSLGDGNRNKISGKSISSREEFEATGDTKL